MYFFYSEELDGSIKKYLHKHTHMPSSAGVVVRRVAVSALVASSSRYNTTGSSSRLSRRTFFSKKPLFKDARIHPDRKSTSTVFSSNKNMSTESNANLRDVIAKQVNISTKEEFVERMPENAWFIRPSGNPANKEILTKMAGEDVTEMKSELLEIKVLDVMSDCAYAVIIAKASFDYKGTKNEDIYTQSLLYKKKGDGWELAWAHRSTGRGFDQDMPGPWP